MNTTSIPVIFLAGLLLTPAPGAQQPAAAPAKPDIRATAEEVVLDVIVRDKRGRELRDLEPGDIEVYDNGVKREIKSLRLVEGREAIERGKTTLLDPLRQVRLVALLFEGLSVDGRRLAKQAALDLIKDPAQNVFYAVLAGGQQLAVVQEFTTDRDKLRAAIERATSGAQLMQFVAQSNIVKEQLLRQAGGRLEGRGEGQVLTGIGQQPAVTQGPGGGAPNVDVGGIVQAKMAEALLTMLDMQQSIDMSERARASIYGLMAAARGMARMPGRKSVLYFTEWLVIPQQLQPEFEAVLSAANRANVSFYSLDARGLQTYGDTGAAQGELSRAMGDIRSAITRDDGRVSTTEITAMERGENAARINPVTHMRSLAEATGGFLISNTNDFRTPLRRLSEELNSFYEITYNPGIEKYDASFRRVEVKVNREEAKVQTRNGYFALPPEISGQPMVLPFELPLLTALTTTPPARDVQFRSAAIHLDPPKNGPGHVSVLLEVPLKSIAFATDAATSTYRARLSFIAMIKDQTGAVVRKFSRDLPLSGPTAQMPAVQEANFTFREQLALGPGRYMLEAAVMDREKQVLGIRKVSFVLAPKPQGVAMSNIALVRRYDANVPNLPADEPFQFNGGRITPTLNQSIPAGKGAQLAMFFTVYPDAAIPEKPKVLFEYIQDGTVVGRGELELPPADAKGRIPYVMSSPADKLKPGMYEIRAVVTQGQSAAEERTFVTIE